MCARDTPFTDGCPGLCSGHGRCTLEQSGWRCVCQAGWSGPGCSVVMETDCSDGTDNDGGDILTSSIIFYLFFSFLPLSFLSLWQLVHSIPLRPVSPGEKKKKNPTHCSSPSFLRTCPSPAETPVESCWSLLYWICICVCASVFICTGVYVSAFPLTTAKCLICIPPARIKGTQKNVHRTKYSKPCRKYFFFFGYQVSGDRWEVCVSQPRRFLILKRSKKESFAHYNHLNSSLVPSIPLLN